MVVVNIGGKEISGELESKHLVLPYIIEMPMPVFVLFRGGCNIVFWIERTASLKAVWRLSFRKVKGEEVQWAAIGQREGNMREVLITKYNK